MCCLDVCRVDSCPRERSNVDNMYCLERKTTRRDIAHYFSGVCAHGTADVGVDECDYCTSLRAEDSTYCSIRKFRTQECQSGRLRTVPYVDPC
jgi:hypothetical protein